MNNLQKAGIVFLVLAGFIIAGSGTLGNVAILAIGVGIGFLIKK